eukprot:TRINITY_DN19144_c0_g1_i1.p1 TRINITY_DN19144_c0_g1~~TRINITY_DN19144_c0_g1_i1.p1  ORF type:complete len:554 (+),score=143.51 TRINITY_DN19144_c0_g1_i1:31-1662(+)
MRAAVVALLCVALVGSTVAFSVEDPNYGGVKCAACTITIGLLQQMTEIRNKTIDKLLDEVCGYFPKEFVPICDWTVNTYGEQVIQMIFNKETPDDICNELPDMCLNSTCRLWPPPTTARPTRGLGRISKRTLADTESPWDWIKNLINHFANNHDPIEDFDHDRYSDAPTLRGYSWRGRDCNDFDSTIHPGAGAPPSGDDGSDYNCNGIHGFDKASGKTYEELFCQDTNQLGLIVIGDSVGAHFEIPPDYLTASQIGNGTYHDLLFVLENEFDWPERSMSTGWQNSTAAVPISSMYQYLRQMNLCNHRDFQNLGVNGARVGDIRDNIKAMNRNHTDTPVLMIYESVGNDVCNPHHTLDRMTTVEDFRTDVVETMQWLDTVLPAGSHVVMIGVVDGRILWDTLHNRTHPVGVSYETVYQYLNCLYLSPCWAWLNSNETIRDAASLRAAQLSAVYPEIIGNYTFQNFDMIYYPFQIDIIFDEWIAQGGHPWDLIEPIDGFHPSQIANKLWADLLWTQLNKDRPQWFGQPNPNNAAILKMFGDQGGY